MGGQSNGAIESEHLRGTPEISGREERCGDGCNESAARCTESAEGCNDGDTMLRDADCTAPGCGDGFVNPEFISPDTGFLKQCDGDGESRAAARRAAATGSCAQAWSSATRGQATATWRRTRAGRAACRPGAATA
jgi:hypothetical protein